MAKMYGCFNFFYLASFLHFTCPNNILYFLDKEVLSASAFILSTVIRTRATIVPLPYTAQKVGLKSGISPSTTYCSNSSIKSQKLLNLHL